MHRILLAVLLLAVVLPAAARENPLSRPLTEEQLRTLVPIMKAEADLLAKDRDELRSDATPPASFDPRATPHGPAAAAPFELKKVLRKHRVSAEQYQDAKIALALARNDARHPEALAERGGPEPDTKTGADAQHADRRTLDVRRQNVELYRRHAAELDPLLDRVL